jgi:hypothetical protein
VEAPEVSAACHTATLPTRRWTDEEVETVREEAEHRLRTGDTTGWLDGFARVIVNVPARLPDRYGGSVEQAVKAVSRFGKEWSEETLADLAGRPETLTTEVQALRVGDAYVVSNGSEFFSSLALDLRKRWGGESLMISGYSNDSLGYMPDAHDVERKTYAAYQSPKFTGQFPFTAESGGVLVQAMLDVLGEVKG